MEVFTIGKGFYKLSKDAPSELSQKELDCLRAITIWNETRDAKLVCETFGISRATLYRWLGRFDPRDLSSLKEQSRRPLHRRKPQWSLEVQRAVKELRTAVTRQKETPTPIAAKTPEGWLCCVTPWSLCHNTQANPMKNVQLP